MNTDTLAVASILTIMLLLADIDIYQADGLQLRLACGGIDGATKYDAHQQQKSRHGAKAGVEDGHGSRIAANCLRVTIQTRPTGSEPVSGLGEQPHTHAKKQQCGNDTHGLQRNTFDQLVPEQHCRHICDHHAKGGSERH